MNPFFYSTLWAKDDIFKPVDIPNYRKFANFWYIIRAGDTGGDDGSMLPILLCSKKKKEKKRKEKKEEFQNRNY